MTQSSRLPILYRTYKPLHNLLTWCGKLQIAGKHPFIVLRNLLNRLLFSTIFTVPETRLITTDDNFVIAAPLNDQSATSILFEKRYSPLESGILSKLLPLTKGFIDVGANLGYFSLLARQVMGDDYPVMTIEPNHHLCLLIENSITQNQFAPMMLYQIAIGDKRGKAYLIVDNTLSSNTRVVTTSVIHPHIQQVVEIIPLNELIDTSISAPLFVKIDVEGHEVQVLNGGTMLFKHRAWILCELQSQSYQAVSDMLNHYDYKMLTLDGTAIGNYPTAQRFDLLLIPVEAHQTVINALKVV
ncbi:MAG: FkbM family methyltransferase [Chloroflexota bacterium]